MNAVPWDRTSGPNHALIRTIEGILTLDAAERKALADIPARSRRLAAGESIIHENDPTAAVHLLQEGLACHYKILPDGRRAILGFIVPGDFCELGVFILDRMNHSIGALAPCTVYALPREGLVDAIERFPRLGRALWWSSLAKEAISREWIVNIGQRSAFERLAHLICELHLRMTMAGLANGGSFDLPITQSEFADSLGLSTVHVNRTLQELRRSGLLSLRGRQADILDIEGLRAAGMFNPAYLHQARRPPTKV